MCVVGPGGTADRFILPAFCVGTARGRLSSNGGYLSGDDCAFAAAWR